MLRDLEHNLSDKKKKKTALKPLLSNSENSITMMSELPEDFYLDVNSTKMSTVPRAYMDMSF